MSRYIALVLAIMLFGVPAWAQNAPIDQRIAGPMVSALKAEIALRDAAIQAMQEDSNKREQQWQEWFKAWCGEACIATPPLAEKAQ